MSWKWGEGAKLRAVTAWLADALNRLGYFAFSVVCGVGIPLSTLGAERLLTGKIGDVSWFSVGVTYVAAVGLASRSRQVLLFALVLAGLLAFLYGVELMAELDKRPKIFSSLVARWCVAAASAEYVMERIGAHLINKRRFPE